MIFDDRGMPWTIRLSLGWTIVLALCCAGTLFIPLGLYLAYWVRTRQGHSAAFWCYLILIPLSILDLFIPEEFARPMSPVATGVLVLIAAGGLLFLLAAPFVLRAEIISLYRQSWGINLPISRFLTFFFSSIYLNYSVPDLPIAPSNAAVPKQA
jgi:hypothetical protein